MRYILRYTQHVYVGSAVFWPPLIGETHRKGPAMTIQTDPHTPTSIGATWCQDERTPKENARQELELLARGDHENRSSVTMKKVPNDGDQSPTSDDAGSNAVPRMEPWEVRQLDQATAIENQTANKRHGVLLGNGYFSLTPMDEQPGREWDASNSFTSWSISAGKIMTKHGEWVDAPIPSGKPALLIGAAIATKIRAIVKAGGNPLEGIGLEETQRALAADLGYSSSGGRTHQELTRQVTGFAVSTLHMAEWGPADEHGGRQYEQKTTTLASKVRLYVPGWGDVLDGLDSHILPNQILVDLATDTTTPPARLDALARMSGAFPIQVASWLEKVLYSIKDGPHRERRFEWKALYAELTHGYAATDNFRRKFLAALNEAAATRRIHGNGIQTNFEIEHVAGRRGGGTRLVIRRSPLLRSVADEL